MWRQLTDYWSRGGLVLRSGPRQDIAIYRDAPFAAQAVLDVIGQAYSDSPMPLTGADGEHPVARSTPSCPSPLFDGRALERAGYTYDYVDRDGLEDALATGRGVLFPKGPASIAPASWKLHVQRSQPSPGRRRACGPGR